MFDRLSEETLWRVCCFFGSASRVSAMLIELLRALGD